MRLLIAIVAAFVCSPAIAADYLGKVLAVSDGDTFTMEADGAKVRIRICGIDAPERGQAGYGQAAGVLAAIPIRKMTIGIAQTLLLVIEWRIAMPKGTTGDRPELKTVSVGAAAIDIGSKMHMAAVNPACTDVPVRSFGTFTQHLHDLADWFKACGVTSVAMESTGIYWIPVYEILEQRGFDVILVNARYAKNVPGRKTDVSDAAWLRQLHSYGLLRGSFRPDAEIATLRAYLRQRERLVEYAAAHIQHMQKALMEMNLQLHHVVSDITGATGMRIIRAVVAGERNPDVLATYRDVRCHSSPETIRAALVGNNRDEHIFALTQSLELYDIYQAKMLDCDRKLEVLIEQQSWKTCRKAIQATHQDQTGQHTYLRCQDRTVRCARRRSD